MGKYVLIRIDTVGNGITLNARFRVMDELEALLGPPNARRCVWEPPLWLAPKARADARVRMLPPPVMEEWGFPKEHAGGFCARVNGQTPA